jgi:hypothetical protein
MMILQNNKRLEKAIELETRSGAEECLRWPKVKVLILLPIHKVDLF